MKYLFFSLVIILISCIPVREVKNVDIIHEVEIEDVNEGVNEEVEYSDEIQLDNFLQSTTPVVIHEQVIIRDGTEVITNNIKNTNYIYGHLSYKIPEYMKTHNSYRVSVKIAKDRNVLISDSTDIFDINISQTMEVRLIDVSPSYNKVFDIVKVNSDKQFIDEHLYTEWLWRVIPIRSGEHSLKVVVSIIRDNNVREIVHEDIVIVENDNKENINLFFSKYWQWLVSTLFIPIFIYLFKKYRK